MCKKIYWILLLGVLVICGIFVFLFNTNIGMYLFITGIAYYYIPGLTFDSVCGNWRNVSVTHMNYHIPGGVIKVDECNISLDLKHIWNKKICLDSLYCNSICVQIDTLDINIDKISQNRLIGTNDIVNVARSFVIKDIILKNINIIVDDNTVFRLDWINTGVEFQDNSFTILSTYIRKVIFCTSVLEKLNIKNNIEILLNKLMAMSSKYNACVNVLLKKVIERDFNIFDVFRNDYEVNDCYLQASLYDQVLNIKLNANLAHGRVDIMSHIVLVERYPITATINYVVNNNCISNSVDVKYLDINRNKTSLIITGDLLGKLCVNYNFLNFNSMVHILVECKIMELGMPISVSVVGRRVPFFVYGGVEYLIEDINLSLNGNLNDGYDIRMQSKLSTVGLSSIYMLDMDVYWGMNYCIFSKFIVKNADGFLSLKGNVDWKDSVSWKCVCILNKCDFLFNQFISSIQLSGNIVAQGCLRARLWEVIISNITLNVSTIDKNCVVEIGSSCGDNDNKDTLEWLWNLFDIFSNKWELISFVTFIQKELCAFYAFDFKVLFDSLHINVIVPGFNISAYGELKLFGPFNVLKISSKINIRSLYWKKKNLTIDKMLVNSDVFYNNLMKSKFFLQANHIKYGSVLLSQVVITGCSDLDMQDYFNLIVTTDGNIFSGNVKCYVHFDSDKQVWNGKISQVDIVTAAGIWRLVQDIFVEYSILEKKIVVSSHIWENIGLYMPMVDVLKINILKEVETVFKNFYGISLKDIPVESIGICAARVYCTNLCWMLGSSGVSLIPTGMVILSGVQLNIEGCDNTFRSQYTLGLVNNMTIKFIMTQTMVSCKWIVDNSEDFGEFVIEYLYNQPNIIGHLQINSISLMPFFNIFFQFKNNINGLLNINVDIKGNVYSPKVYGSIILKDIIVDNCYTDFFIKSNSYFLIKLYGDYAILDGTISTDNGRKLNVNGSVVDYNSIDDICMSIKIKGDRINFKMHPEASVEISPNIICTVTSKNVYITGDVDVPWADLKIQDFSKNMAEISSEEVLLDDNYQLLSNNSKCLSSFISYNFNVRLGNNVVFTGLGLCAKLRGNLGIGYNNSNLTLTGHVDIVSGYFRTYGQNLIIKKGQLLFSGTVDEPYLYIEAIRDSSCMMNNNKDEITVGIRIAGPFNQLKLESFSDSELLSQQEVVSYLLVGGNSLIFSDINVDLLKSLLVGASVQHSERMINKLGKIFGVYDLTINTQSTGPTSLVSVSGCVAPGLQVKYGINIFDLLTTITVRYSLYSNFYLEAISGNNQSFGVLYQFDY